ncbi:MAG: LPS-assembly protein LptD, partial [Bacteroidales bacterium]|nr:LPS-assembly protein LptD [Bacteroidales bacterium]
MLLTLVAFELNAQDSLLVAVTDSITPEKKDEGISDPVDYGSEDSVFFDLNQQKSFLYGTAYIKMGSFELKAGYIEIDFNSQKIYARGIEDSTGIVTQKPEYTEGAEKFVADEVIYDYKSKKGTVKGVRTEQSDGFLFADQAKMQDNGEYHFVNGRYTTCNDPDHPHYYIQMTKAKVVDGKKIVTGPFYFVIEDIPMPIALPFGYFPSKAKRSSGILMPAYGEENLRGFFLKNMGYYFAISDYADLSIQGDMFSYGSWALRVNSKYKYRYHFNGSVQLSLNNNVTGE